MKEVILETLPKNAHFWREKEAVREGVVVAHTPGGTMVELREPQTITIHGKEIQRTKTTRVQFARQAHVWVKK